MKNILKYSWMLGLLMFSSCSNWLNVEPFDQVSEEQQYGQAGGFYNQLNGIYKEMAGKELYGKELSWGFLDVLAQYYDMGSYSECDNYGYRNAAALDYENERVKPFFDIFWEKGYNIIANCNNLIQNTVAADSNLFPFREMERRCIEGEARALRAMLHFDILRMYAPAPNVDSTGKHIAYVEQFPTHIPLDIPTNQVLEKIQQDLIEAHRLTADYDTTYTELFSDVNFRLEVTGNGSVHRFMDHRGYRLNHYAIKVLLARVALYRGDKAAALSWAKEAYRFFNWLRFNSEYDIKDYMNMKLYNDVMFALYNNNLASYEAEENTGDSKMVAWDYGELFSSDANRDYRRWQWESTDDGAVPMKYKERKETNKEAKVTNKLIPMIRISEIFYIMAECLYESDPAGAKVWLDYVRQSRGCRTASPDAMTQDEFNKLILKDFRREFYGEGQLFFFYKRLGLDAIGTSSTTVQYGTKYVFPKPESNDI